VSTVFDWGAFALSLPLTAIAVVVVMGVTFGTALRLGRHSVVDVAWGLGFVAVAGTSYALGAGHGDPTRRLMVLLLTAVWGVRLAVHIGMRSRGAGEDRRYAALLDRAPGNRALFALKRIYFTQGVTLWFVSLPVQVASFEPAGSKAVMALGVLLWLVGFGFESVGTCSCPGSAATPPRTAPSSTPGCGATRGTRTTSATRACGGGSRWSRSAPGRGCSRRSHRC
jgi:steroid 5-alpha reductase family enzyme